MRQGIIYYSDTVTAIDGGNVWRNVHEMFAAITVNVFANRTDHPRRA
jgi:hypothetical protein